MLLAGHITTVMQASCQRGDYVSLKALSNSTAKQGGSSQFSQPKCCQQMCNAEPDGWVGGERRGMLLIYS